MKKHMFSLVAAIGFCAEIASAQTANFTGQWVSNGNGVLSITQSGSSFTATMSGSNSDWWGPMKNRGGFVNGTVNGRTLNGIARDGVGNVSTVQATLSADGRSFSGSVQVTAGPLRGAASGFGASRAPGSVPAGIVWRELETGLRTVDGTWTWNAARNQATGRWSNGAYAIMTLVSDDGRSVVLRRYDPSGSSAGLLADYVGVRNGNSIRGTVTWRDPMRKTQRTGTWSASW